MVRLPTRCRWQAERTCYLDTNALGLTEHGLDLSMTLRLGLPTCSWRCGGRQLWTVLLPGGRDSRPGNPRVVLNIMAAPRALLDVLCLNDCPCFVVSLVSFCYKKEHITRASVSQDTCTGLCFARVSTAEKYSRSIVCIGPHVVMLCMHLVWAQDRNQTAQDSTVDVMPPPPLHPPNTPSIAQQRLQQVQRQAAVVSVQL